MDWIKEAWDWITGSGDAVSDVVSSGSESVDFFSSIGTDINTVWDSIQSTFDNELNFSRDPASRGAMPVKLATSNEPSLLDRVGGAYKKNKGLFDLAGAALSSYASNEAKEKAAEKLAQSRLNELREKDKIDQEGNARFSASVSGLRPSGLIGSSRKLQRVGGGNVFNNTGGLIRG